MNDIISWESWLHRHFPGYLLPSSARQSISEEEAARFVARLSDRPDQLELLKTASLISAWLEELCVFAERELPELARVLDSRTVVEHRVWEGGFQGALDVRATLGLHLAGRQSQFVTRNRRRDFDLLENRLVRYVAETLLIRLEELREVGVLKNYGWGEPAAGLEGQLRHLLSSSRLREVTLEPPSHWHYQAARGARHPTYESAERWVRRLDRYLHPSQKDMAELVARGALTPLDPDTRFELAVLTRLMEALWTRLGELAPGKWQLEHGLIRADRTDVAMFRGPAEKRLVVHYNQAVLEAGARDLGVRHYLGSSGRLRPDITLERWEGRARKGAVVIEIKHSHDIGYLISGYEEALAYRHEYATALTGWPKAILVTSSPIPGEVRPEDDVVAEDWRRWPSRGILDGLLEGME